MGFQTHGGDPAVNRDVRAVAQGGAPRSAAAEYADPIWPSGAPLRSGTDLVAWLRTHGRAAPLTRFAPAPTGFLHLGHVVNAIYVWGLARALGGRVLLRIEDHDRQRCRSDYERALLDDLDWLGFEPEVYPTAAYRGATCDGRQSERDAVYRAALAPLISAGMVYGCCCSRADIERASEASDAVRSHQPGEQGYPGTCREMKTPLVDGVGWRLRIEPGVETFEDGLLGPQSQDPPAQCGDLLLRDRLGNWTYQCVATIDDFVQGVSLVIRGVDLLASTGRQIRLARLLGRSTPATFVHHPLVMKTPEHKLSKSDRDTGVRDLRALGWSATDMLAYAARLACIGDLRMPNR
jgi:glutamyl/glutaminyl-tRNA synthetase